MKKKWTALLLALVLSLSLLPTAALADNTPATGIYLNQELTGDCISATQKDGGAWGYWNISYSNAQNVFYYYDPRATCLTVPGSTRGVSTESVSSNLWKITVSGRSDSFVVDLNTSENGSSYCFQFVYHFTPSEGLHYRSLTEQRVAGQDDPLIVEDVGEYLPLSGIKLAPFVDRMSIALYYYDGTDYEPVNRVRLPAGSGFDMVWVRDWMRNEKLPAHWYYLSAYDFAESKLSYFTGENYNASDAEPTGFIDLNSHQLPPVAFYADDADEPSEGAYRMYTVMDKNTDQSKAYNYTTTLYLCSENGTVEFADGVYKSRDEADAKNKNTIECFQKHYDRNGMENANDPETVYTSYDVDIERIKDGKVLKVTVYANDSDLLLWLYGPEGEDQYAAYVNLLAPDHTQIRLNDQGFEAAKYLPKHLFQQLAEKGLPVTLSAGDYAADITCNETLTADIANANGSATLEINGTSVTESQAAAIASANSDAQAVNAVDITLAYGGEAQHEFTEGGSATVSYPCDLNLADGETVQVYYVSDSGETELIDATYDAESGCVTFTTTHFSTFVIVKVPTTPSAPDNDPPSAPSYSDDDSEPTYSVKLEAEGIQSSRRTAEEGELMTLTVKEGYDITDILVTDQNGNAVKITYKDGKYTFRMPKGKITVTAVYASAAPAFTDVEAGYWALSAIQWAAEQGYMNGLTASTFAPEGAVSRQQVWMILARLSGAAPADMAAARAWAIANGVSDGSAPGAAVTRQQLVTLLYRYAVLMGHDVSTGEDTNILSYSDAFDVADYAVAAFQWACGTGIIGGTTPDTLSPLGGATRAQFAVILSRFCGAAV